MKTTNARILSVGLLASLILAAIAITAPSAAAQGEKPITIDNIVFDDKSLGDIKRILPETGVVSIPVTADVHVPPASGCVVNVVVKFSVTGPTYSTPYTQPPSVSFPVDFGQTQPAPVTGGSEQKRQVSTKVIISVNRQAPAFQDGTYEISIGATAGSSSGGCNVAGTAQDSKGKYTLKNDYLPLTQVNAQTLYQKVGQNKKVVFPVDIVNQGNGPTRVKIELTPSGKNRLDSYNPGAEIRGLDSKAGNPTANNKITRNIEVTTPHSNGYTNSISTFTAKFTSKFDGQAPGELAEDTSEVVFNVQIQGVYVPGFDPTGLIAALGAVGLGLGRFRRPG